MAPLNDILECLDEETGHYGIIVDGLYFIPLYSKNQEASGVGISFSALPVLDATKEYHGGGLVVCGYARRDGRSHRIVVQHQCRTSSSGYDGAKNTIAIVVNIQSENSRLMYQILPQTVRAIAEAEHKVGISKSPLRDQFFTLLASDLAVALGEVYKSGEVSDAAGLSIGLLLRNLLNLDMDANEEHAIVKMFSKRRLCLDLISKIETNPAIDHDSGETRMLARLGTIKAHLLRLPDRTENTDAPTVPRLKPPAPMEPQIDVLERASRDIFHTESRAFLVPEFGDDAPDEVYDPDIDIYDEEGYLVPCLDEPVPTEYYDPDVDAPRETVGLEIIHEPPANLKPLSECVPWRRRVFFSCEPEAESPLAPEVGIISNLAGHAVPLGQILAKKRRGEDRQLFFGDAEYYSVNPP